MTTKEKAPATAPTITRATDQAPEATTPGTNSNLRIPQTVKQRPAVNVSTLPEELRKSGLFCLWRYEERDGKQTKVPYNPHSPRYRGDSTDPEKFAPIKVVLPIMKAFDGIGVGVFDKLSGMDIDHCIDDAGELTDLAKDIVETMDCYTEKSPSGHGVRMLFKAPGFTYDKSKYYIKNDKIGLEVYVAGSTNRFLTVTGNSIRDGNLVDRSAQLQKVLDKYMTRPTSKAPKESRPAPAPLDMSDTEIIDKALNAKNGSLFAELWAGDTSRYQGDDSAADLALCNLLAFWTGGDADRMDRLFRSSGLMRPKWDSKRSGTTYGRMTVEAALASCTEHYTPIERKGPGPKHDEDVQREKLIDTIPTEVLAELAVETDRNGEIQKIKTTATNFRKILEMDRRFASIKFNLLRMLPERVDENGKRTLWTDDDDAAAMVYIESIYGMFSKEKYLAAFRTVQRERDYNPAQEQICSIKWDGKSRVSNFLIKWFKLPDTEYNQEVSRILFAGKIHRLFEPGCKFDFCIVFIGPQGCGKSTMCQLLALDYSASGFYAAIRSIGQKGIEAIDGKTVIELEELLGATTVTSKQTATVEDEVKAFLSRSIDTYRRPYDRRPNDYPRSCIFIGTTNRRQFLSDPTGNRRWLPIVCGTTTADELYSRREELEEDIRQACAEMYSYYETGSPMASTLLRADLTGQIERERDKSTLDDWRVDAIIDYLDDKPEGYQVCALEIYCEVLNPSNKHVFAGDSFARGEYNSQTDGAFINGVISSLPEWERIESDGGRFRTRIWGRQRGWVKTSKNPFDE